MDAIPVNRERLREPISSESWSWVVFRGHSALDLRNAKRVKLSPKADFYGKGNGDGAVISRPKIIIRRDYVGESRSLMQQIRQARDCSTISTTTTNIQGPNPSDDEQENDPDGRCSTIFHVCSDVSVNIAPPPKPSLLGVHEKSRRHSEYSTLRLHTSSRLPTLWPRFGAT